ncbi:FtsL-like putative cell division protein [Flavicella sp.]|jgi:replicative DNA helicase|nr:FtsL-like putative cell division protein [Flavicella sp.]MDA9111490.1 FtsL-like putative cell division protein [Flavicella sp.]|tara:strand:+ start:9648 stop:9968 length:321 start_codon:yes stop_codon:yes gene_type:complete
MKIYSILKGSFLVDEGAFKNWKIILFVVVLLLFMISSAHSADRKVMQVARLNAQMKMMKSIYIDSGTQLTRMKMESSVRAKVKDKGLRFSAMPPVEITVITKNKLN